MANKKVYTVTLTLPDGTRKYYRASTKKEAENKRAADRLLIAQGVKLRDNPTFGDVAKTWFALYERQNKHTRTIETTEGVLNRYILPVLGDKKIKEIDIDTLEELLITIKDYSLSTQKKVIQLTSRILDRAVAKNIIYKTPVDKEIFKPSAKKPKEVVPLTDEQCRVIFEGTKGTRAYPFVVLLRYTGIRKGEAIGLMWRDIDFENCTMHIQRSVVYTVKNRQGVINPELKTEQADRVIPLNDEVMSVLRAEKQKSKSLYVFPSASGSYLTEASFRRMWDIVDRAAKGFEVHPHLLRHTCISAWAENGLEISEAQYLAGHATSDITARVYTHYREQQQKQKTAEKIRAMSIKEISV